MRGFVDLGLAENKLCEDLVAEKLKNIPTDLDETEIRYYADVKGLLSFRNALQTFIEREFQSAEPLKVENIIVASGVTLLLESLAFTLAEPGDYIMTTSPYYYRIRNDLNDRAAVNILEVPLASKSKSDGVEPFTLEVDILEEAYLQARSQGKLVRAVLMVNPSNPLGNIYTRQQLIDLLQFTAKYHLHLIMDEIYGLTTFDPETTFTSVLELHHPDPERVHFLWGFSKDFGLSGYRCGVLYSKNRDVLASVTNHGMYMQIPGPIQWRLEHLITDKDWFQREYLPTMRKRLRQRYDSVRHAFWKYDVAISPVSGAIFIWIDLSKYLPGQTFVAEDWLMEKFMKEKVFLLPGQACYSPEPGFFRVVFSLDEMVLAEGMTRIQNVLDKIYPNITGSRAT